MAEAAKNTPGGKGPEGPDTPIAATNAESNESVTKATLSQRADELSARLEEHKKQAKAQQDARAAKAAAAAKAAFLNPSGAKAAASKPAEAKPAAPETSDTKPAANPTTVQPATTPATAKPAATKPVANPAPAKPVATKPAASKPAAAKPATAAKPAAAAKSAAAKPAVSKPATSAAKPKTDEPVEDIIRAIKLPHELDAEQQQPKASTKAEVPAKSDAPLNEAKQTVPPVSAAPNKDNPETTSAAVAQARSRVFGNYAPESEPSEAAVKRRVARERALNSKPPLARTAQVLLALIFPVLTLIAAIRLVATPAFLALAYARPGFPSDQFGFTDPERLTYGSYGVDYLNNFAGPEFLSGLKLPTGSSMFTAQEVQHMLDVKNLIGLGYVIGAVLAVLAIIFIVYLANRYSGGVRRALFSGAILTLVLIAGIAVIAITGWNTFFSGFHQLFFAEGTWTFNLSDTLIRLYPEQFWVDSALAIGVLVVVSAVVALITCWPTGRRRESSRLRQEARVYGLNS
ncbi:TIGR01906 family membrane protein [Glutamicibacter sp. 287]|uniref:TIGR01906 family membrane protein n=1 Tax=unclassified Glutamicibacter TaxID=2627139 RepID=UPI000BB86B93|nr:TIGR01906 family membrane protein [Glutamicibacter sp. BW80]PCC28071.1 TIGR01906 family membrane protein [Glutamicibacter sp. BW80]